MKKTLGVASRCIEDKIKALPCAGKNKMNE
jgi:hypothetical protein